MKMVPIGSIEQDHQANDRTDANLNITGVPSPHAIRVWQEVAAGIDRSQTVVWKAAVESLENALRYLLTSNDARRFAEGHMRPCISILLDQQPLKIGQVEKACVEDSLRRAVQIVAKDLDFKKGPIDAADGALLQECLVLDTLSFVFNRKKTYYKGSKQSWNMAPCGAPEVRIQMINKFHAVGGWVSFATYLENRARLKPEQFPNAEALHHILSALLDLVPDPTMTDNNKQRAVTTDFRDEAAEAFTIRICHAVMNYIDRTSDESSWKKQANDVLSNVVGDLKYIFYKLAPLQRAETFKFFEFWRKLTLKLITSQSLPLRLFGWEQVGDLIAASREMRPPPKSFFVEGAGLSFVNGEYEYNGPMDDDGYASRGAEISYCRCIPATETNGGKKITLFRCTMRSQLKWWFLSEADEDQPGTDKDIDYYQHKTTRSIDDSVPPKTGWVTCKNAGHDPPPTLRSSGVMAPTGEELNTLEHQLAKWAISNGVIELVLGDSVHREVVSRSKELIRFLADMCDKNEAQDSSDSNHSKTFCLQRSHLLLAWRACTSKADSAVSVEVYTLLVSILPSLPVELAIYILAIIQKSLKDGAENDKHDLLPEVSDFCSTLAKASSPDNNNQVPFYAERVRKEILTLLWQVLIHPGAPSLKTYENLKNYVASELQIEPYGEIYRRNFLDSCMNDIKALSESEVGEIDEALALQKVKLTRFILEAYPRSDARSLVTKETPQLPQLMFKELLSYLLRRTSVHLSPNSRRMNSSFAVNGHAIALAERLSFLRFAYSLSFDATMTNAQLDKLWDLCSAPADKEALMIFLAAASDKEVLKTAGPSTGDQLVNSISPSASVTNDGNDELSAVFTYDTCLHAFDVLLCSPDVNWDVLGEKAYLSFHTLFCRLRNNDGALANIHGTDIDAMWRIFLTSSSNDVASQSMKDLLTVYTSAPTSSSDPGAKKATLKGAGKACLSASEKSFVQRIFDCLVQVKKGLEAGNPTSQRSAERCLRILNAAFGQDTVAIGDGTALSEMSTVDSAAQALACVPHGMRGQACYRTINILGRYTSPQSNSFNSVGIGPVQPHLAVHSDAAPAPISKLPSSEKILLQVHPLETLLSVKHKVSQQFKHPVDRIKALSISGRTGGKSTSLEMPAPSNLNIIPEDTTVTDLGITDGCEIMFLLAGNPLPASNNVLPRRVNSNQKPFIDLASVFADGDSPGSEDHFFDTLLSVLEALPEHEELEENNSNVEKQKDSSALVWDLLLSMSSNPSIVERVNSLASGAARSPRVSAEVDDNAVMALDQIPEDNWSSLIDGSCCHRSAYTLQIVESFLSPAPEILCYVLDESTRIRLKSEMINDAVQFRRGFINTGGFDAVLRLFTQGSNKSGQRRRTRRSDATALRILRCCFMGNTKIIPNDDSFQPDQMGDVLLDSVPDPSILLYRLTEVVVSDSGVPDSTILNSLCLVRLLLSSRPALTNTFVSLPHDMPEKYVTSLLLRKDKCFVAMSSGSPGAWVRKCTGDLVTKNLSYRAFPWLTAALHNLDMGLDNTSAFFDALHFLVKLKEIKSPLMKSLGTVTCKKMAEQARQMNTSTLPSIECATGVLSGCLNLLKVIIEVCGGESLVDGVAILVSVTGYTPWSKESFSALELNSTISATLSEGDGALVDLMGAVFDGYLTSATNPMLIALCCDKESRRLGFDVVATAAKACNGGVGYIAIVRRIKQVISFVAPYLRHRWCLNLSVDETSSRSLVAKYSGLRNQGCTCYMNSFLQQLFMMSDLRKNLCSAPMPTRMRSGGVMFSKGADLVGKRITLQWETGMSYDAVVDKFDPGTGMHTIRYCTSPPISETGDRVAITNRARASQNSGSFLLKYPDEFILAEGRPGKETGVFEISTHFNKPDDVIPAGEGVREHLPAVMLKEQEESDEQACARRLLEEIQRTFVHLEEGARGRCFDPRSLVEASGCLKLEFDVWQQNDASEYAMKLLDRLEVPLKRYAPRHFKYLQNTFGLKQTKQKYCKECGLKTNREENMMNIDCQIRGKSDIHEALETMCEVEYMEGDNKVFCDRCKKKCDTVLRTAISALPKVLVLSLKRFDLDYNTFETVKLNSRCAFGHRLNMKKYTLEGVDAIDKANTNRDLSINSFSTDGDAVMDPVDAADVLSSLPDEEYEYNLVGVLVHAGVAQGGHYYSYIKDRSPSDGETADKWYRFDDEDVTPFDPANIEPECFGGKVKKETKWPNGQLHTVESEQFANALMLFYEKVTSCNRAREDDESNSDCAMEDVDYLKEELTTGYDVFQTDVRRANTTYAWCEFLSDADFQEFMKNLIKTCQVDPSVDYECDKMELSPHRPLSPSARNPDSGYSPILQVSLMYLFDVLLHSYDKSMISQWVHLFCVALEQDKTVAKWLTNDIARRTSEVSGNWLRTFFLECPDETARAAFTAIVTNAISASSSCPSEVESLNTWTHAWLSQLPSSELLASVGLIETEALPTRLGSKYRDHEDVEKIGTGLVCSIGIVISEIATILEHCPCSWQNSLDICILIRDLSCRSVDDVRVALAAAQIPARLICLMMREDSPALLKVAFPGSSLPQESASLMVRPEALHSSPAALPHGVGAGGGVSIKVTERHDEDYILLLETLGCVIGLDIIKRAPLLVDELDQKGRLFAKLSKPAIDCFTRIFDDFKCRHGMGARELEQYVKCCGHNQRNHAAQKILQRLNKYDSVVMRDGSKESRYLTLVGFLDYYRDLCQNNEVQVRMELHILGFRPDLSRREKETRIGDSGDQRVLDAAESVSLDVASYLKNKNLVSLGCFAELGLSSFYLYYLPLTLTHLDGDIAPLIDYILAASAFKQDSASLLTEALAVLNEAFTSSGNEHDTIHTCIKIFKVLLSIPDDRQNDRFQIVMCSERRIQSYPGAACIGLFAAARDLSRAVPHYSASNYHHGSAADRYVEIVSMLYGSIRAVNEWMGCNRDLWSWMDQRRSDRERNRVAAMPRNHPIAANHNQYTNSNLVQEVGNESEGEDEEYRLDQSENVPRSSVRCERVEVSSAGTEVINGVYREDGMVDGVSKYSKPVIIGGRNAELSLYRCQLQDSSRKWFISVVPGGQPPGTNKDIDYYWAPCINDVKGNFFPPEQGWELVKGHGELPIPLIRVIIADEEDMNVSGQSNGQWNEDEDHIEDEGERHVL